MVVSLSGRLVLPLVGSRLLGRFVRPGHHPLWGLQCFLLWYVGGLLRLSFLSIFSDTAMASPYLRLLGAKVGTSVHIGTANIGLPSMVSIGSRTSIGYGASLQTGRVEDGWMIVAPVHIDQDAFVGASALLEPGASVAKGGRLAEHSLAARN